MREKVEFLLAIHDRVQGTVLMKHCILSAELAIDLTDLIPHSSAISALKAI